MLEAPLPPHATLPIALVPLTKSSPERRITQKEIIAGEERPKFLTIKQVQDSGSQGRTRMDEHISMPFECSVPYVCSMIFRMNFS